MIIFVTQQDLRTHFVLVLDINNIDYYHNKSEKWIEQSQKLFCKHLDGEAVGGDVKVDEYLEQLRE